MKIKLTSGSEHINEKGDGPYRGFGYLSLFGDPINFKQYGVNFPSFDMVVDTETSIIQMGPNILNVG